MAKLQKNQRRQVQWDVATYIAKETNSQKMRYGADLLQIAVFPLIAEAWMRSRNKIKQRDYEILEGTGNKNLWQALLVASIYTAKAKKFMVGK